MGPVIEVRSGTTVQARLAARALRMTVRPWLSYWPLTPRGLRPLSAIERVAPAVLPAHRWARVEGVRFADFQAEWVRAPQAAGDRVVLYLHGGGFFFCGRRTHRRMVARISAASAASVLSVAYRQQPLAPLAVSVADCAHAYRWLLEQGYDSDRIVVAGDSTGGFLAFAATLRVLEQGLPVPAAIVAFAPLTDLDLAAKAAHQNAKSCACFSMRTVQRNIVLLATDGIPPDPMLSPVNGRLADLPPVLIQAGSTELLLPDAELLAQRLAEAGVPCRLQIWERQVHVFQILADLVPEGMAALREVGTFIREHTPNKITA